MAMIDAINVTGPRIEAPDVIDHQINLGDFFTTPQMAYVRLRNREQGVGKLD